MNTSIKIDNSSSQITQQIKRIADKFSKAANSYNNHNQLQRLTGQLLQEQMCQSYQQVNTLLDIGAGPGTDFSQAGINANRVVCLDIAIGMLKALKQQYENYSPICADAANLPLANNSVDCIYSNLALQWCPDFDQAIAEIYRVLSAQGHFSLALPIDGSLTELNQLGLTKNNFISAEQLNHIINKHHWQSLRIDIQDFCFYFDDLKSLVYSIKGVGASTATRINSEHKGLLGKAFWQQVTLNSQKISTTQGIPLSYQIAIIYGQK